MTPVLTITPSGIDCPEYGWGSRAALPYPLRIDSVLRTDGVRFCLPVREVDYGVCFSIFRIGAWSRYVLRTGWERLRDFCITVTARIREFVRVVRRLRFREFPAAVRAAARVPVVLRL